MSTGKGIVNVYIDFFLSNPLTFYLPLFEMYSYHVIVIFCWLFLFSSTETTLIDELQCFPDRTIRSRPLKRRVRTPRTWLGIALSHQKVYPLAFTSNMLLKKHSFFQAAVVSILLYGCTTWLFLFSSTEATFIDELQ